MRNKIFLVTLSFLVFINSFFMVFPDLTQAFASKVAQKSATKVVKEIAKNEAETMVLNMVLDYTYKPPSDDQIKKLNTPTATYKPSRHYPKFKNPRKSHAQICLDLKKKRIQRDNEIIEFCEQPLEVKKNLTVEDKKKISDDVEKKLDKAMYNKGFMKFLNWFFPIWIVGTSLTVIDLLLDNDLSNFFSDLAYDSLVDLGFLTNLEKEVFVSNSQLDIPTDHDKDYDSSWNDIGEFDGSIVGGITVPQYKIPAGISLRPFNENSQIAYFDKNFGYVNELILSLESTIPYTYINSSGREHYVFDPYGKPVLKVHFTTRPVNHFDGSKNITLRKLDKMKMYMGKVDAYAVSDTLITYKDIDISHYDYFISPNRPGGNLTSDEINLLLKIAAPTLSEFKGNDFGSFPPFKTDDVPFTKPNTTIKVPSPVSVPVIDIKTGEPVKPSPESTPESTVYVTPDGTPVPESDIEIGDITIIEGEDGLVVKNPNPDDTTVSEGVITDPNNPSNPPDGSTDPESPSDPNNPTKPPGGSTDPESPSEFVCTAVLNKPNFSMLAHEFSTTFPFNIPFDIYTSFKNLFVGIGSERPSFEYKMKVFDHEYDVDITLPEIFDDWMPFVRSVILFSFDVGLLFLIFRITGGGK